MPRRIIEDLPEGFKRCSQDKEVKPLDEFNKSSRSRDGHRAACRECEQRRCKNYKPREEKEILPEGFKRCTKTGEIHPTEEFSKNKNTSDGLQSWCKACFVAHNETRKDEKSAYGKERYAETREIRKAQNAIWRANNPNYMKEWHLANPDYMKTWTLENTDYIKTWRLNNTEKEQERSRNWYLDNLERAKENHKNWKQANPEKLITYDHNRAARLRENGGEHTTEEWLDLLEQYDYTCVYPGCSVRHGDDGKPLTRDHVEPVSKGGSNDISNIQPLCGYHNGSKGNYHSTDYRVLWQWLPVENVV